MKKIRVLQLMTAFVVGGAQKVLLDLLANLDREQFDCSVICLTDHDDMMQAYRDHDIEVMKMDMQKTPADFIRVFRHLDRYIRDQQVDIIHAHMFHPLPFASLLKLRHPRLKVIFTSHNTRIEGGKVGEWITRLSKPLRNHDVIFSDDMRAPHYKAPVVIPNGIEIGHFKTRAEKKTVFTFLNIGTIRHQKNQIFLVECARTLKDKGHSFRIDVVGGGEENQQLINELEQAIVDADVQQHMRLLGVRSDIPDLLKSAHCMVLPSHYEGLPIVLLEAGAAGLPVISTPVGAIPTVLDDSNGYLVELDDFCDAMEHVLNEYAEAQQKAESLMTKIDNHYSIQGMVRAHADLYRSVLSKQH